MKNKTVLFLILSILSFSFFLNGQTRKEILLEKQKTITKENLLLFLTHEISTFEACVPVNIVSDHFAGKVIIYGGDLCYYYLDEICDTIAGVTCRMTDFYIFFKSLMDGDTLFINNSDKKLRFSNIPKNDSVLDYPIEKKQQLIDMAFNSSGKMKREGEEGYQHFNEYAVISKLFEWGVLVINLSDSKDFHLFDHSIYENIYRNGEFGDMINDCLFFFIDSLQLNKKIYVNESSFYGKFIIDDFEITRRKLSKVNDFEMKSMDWLNSIDEGVIIVRLDDIILHEDEILFTFKANKMVEIPNFSPYHREMIFLDEVYIYQFQPNEKKWVNICDK